MLLLLSYVLQHVTAACTIIDGVVVVDAAVGVADGASFSVAIDAAVDVVVGAAVGAALGCSVTTAAAAAVICITPRRRHNNNKPSHCQTCSLGDNGRSTEVVLFSLLTHLKVRIGYWSSQQTLPCVWGRANEDLQRRSYGRFLAKQVDTFGT